MDSERFQSARSVPGTGNRDFTARVSHTDIFSSKTENPSLAVPFHTPATFTLKPNHGCTSKILDGKEWPLFAHNSAAVLESLEGSYIEKELTQAGASVERERKEYGEQR